MANVRTYTRQQAASPHAGRQVAPLALAILFGLVVGGVVGAGATSALLANASPAAQAGGPADAGAGGHYLLENLVINPADSEGARFLMVSVAFAVRDEETAEALEARELEIRDVLLGILGAKSVAQLADITARDALKAELRTGVDSLFRPGTVRKIYLPQYVIQ